MEDPVKHHSRPRVDSLADFINSHLGRPRNDSLGTDLLVNSGAHSKRSRAGSISGRLRAASDLADFGLIDATQKAAIKDMIISDDPVLRAALDKYEKGDLSELHEIIKDGNFRDRKQSLDLLDGLDLDFLNVNKFLDGNNGSFVFDSDSDFLFGPQSFGTGSIYDSDLVDTKIDNMSATPIKISRKPRVKPIAMEVLPTGEVDMSMYAATAAALERTPRRSAGSGNRNRSTQAKASLPGSVPTTPNPPIKTPPSMVVSSMQKLGGNEQYSFGLGSGIQISIPRTNEFSSVLGSSSINAGYIGAYSPESRRERIAKFLEKRTRRVWTKKVKYDVRKNFADSRLRVKGRFVKKEDEEVLRDLLHPF